MRKAQGTLEYFMGFGVALVVGLVLIGASVVLLAPADDEVSVEVFIARASMEPLGLDDVALEPDGNVFLVLKNNTGRTATITRIDVGDYWQNFSNKISTNGAEFFVVDTGYVCTEGLTEELDVTVQYETTLPHVQTYPGSVPFYCDDVLTSEPLVFGTGGVGGAEECQYCSGTSANFESSNSFDRGYDNDSANDIVVDSSGNVYLVGTTHDSPDTYLTLVKYDSLNNLDWNVDFNAGYTDSGIGVGVDSSGNVYVVGSSNPEQYEGNYITFAKYDSFGNQDWNKLIGTGSGDYGRGISVDSSNNIYLSGNVFSGGNKLFLAKYDSLGVQDWNVILEYALQTVGTDIDVDDSGNIYVTGQINEGVVVDIITVKYNSLGVQDWNVAHDMGDLDSGVDVAVDNSGNVYVACSKFSTTTFENEAVLLKYNSSGVLQWDVNLNDTEYYAGGVDVDVLGNIYLSGTKRDGSLFDIFLAKYDSLGNQDWNIIYDGGAADGSSSIFVNSDGEIYVAGNSYTGATSNYFTAKYTQNN